MTPAALGDELAGRSLDRLTAGIKKALAKGGGVVGFQDLVQKALLPHVAGRTVLDVGGYDGGQARWALDNGARHAMCVDSGQWDQYGWQPPRHHEGVVYIDADVMAWGTVSDIVICQNVIYHQRNPWMFLERLRTLTAERLVLCTSFVDGAAPLWMVYRPGEGHPVSKTVAWRPTPLGLHTLLEAVGFEDVREEGREGDHIVVSAR